MYNPDGIGSAKHVNRSDLMEDDSKRVRYYFIDFGISTWFRDRSRTELGKDSFVTGWHGIDRDVPELFFPDDPYDPFPVDVYIIGNLIKKTFVEVSDISNHSGRTIQ